MQTIREEEEARGQAIGSQGCGGKSCRPHHRTALVSAGHRPTAAPPPQSTWLAGRRVSVWHEVSLNTEAAPLQSAFMSEEPLHWCAKSVVIVAMSF